VRLKGLVKLKKWNDHTGKRNSDFPAYGIVPQLATVPRVSTVLPMYEKSYVEN
jgi:hypothetical protein